MAQNRLKMKQAIKCDLELSRSGEAWLSLMALGMSSVGLANVASFTRLHWFAEPNELFGRQWLLCYEGSKQGWLTPPSRINALGVHSQFELLWNRDVSVFNVNAPAVPPRRHEAASDGCGGGSGGGEYPM